jgi:23S rRNA (cytidine1920-2'-O)/16S rRNA (cytidine1409-2'-O)-methyltransferase
VLLVERGLCETRARAQARILAGDVLVDDMKVDKAGTQVPVDAEIRLKGEGLKYVSRGGLKLEGALDRFGISPEGRVCLDVGASTGGFTDVLLQRGAARVYAVDVGYGQLAWRLRSDERVVVLERTHIAKLEEGALSPKASLGVVDVSFISLTRVLEPMLRHLEETCELVALVKPQFEVGREAVGKGGIVRDVAARERALENVLAFATSLGLRVVGQMESPIQGADGNVEYLAAFARLAPDPAQSP